MKQQLWFLVLGLMIIVAGAGIFVMTMLFVPKAQTKPIGVEIMKLSSAAFINNGAIPERYSCQGDRINPPLAITGVPKQTGALALVVDDPDAPGGTYDHWIVWNIPVSTSEIPEDWTVPQDVSVGANGSGKDEWTAPCPPSGTHHYHFKLYALDGTLDLTPGATKGKLEYAMSGHVVAQAELVGTYTKQ